MKNDYQKLPILGKALVNTMPGFENGGYCYDTALAVRDNAGFGMKVGYKVKENGDQAVHCFNYNTETGDVLDMTRFPEIIIEKRKGIYIEDKVVQEEFKRTIEEIESHNPGYMEDVQTKIKRNLETIK